MMSRFLEGVHLNAWILSTTPIYLSAFLALIVWVYRGSRKQFYQQLGQLPLESSSEETHVAR